MSTPNTNSGTADVPARVFEQFLDSLKASGVPSEVIERLRKTLMEDKVFNERGLKAALLCLTP